MLEPLAPCLQSAVPAFGSGDARGAGAGCRTARRDALRLHSWMRATRWRPAELRMGDARRRLARLRMGATPAGALARLRSGGAFGQPPFPVPPARGVRDWRRRPENASHAAAGPFRRASPGRSPAGLSAGSCSVSWERGRPTRAARPFLLLGVESSRQSWGPSSRQPAASPPARPARQSCPPVRGRQRRACRRPGEAQQQGSVRSAPIPPASHQPAPGKGVRALAPTA